MGDSAGDEIREREQINARLQRYWSLPSWTPAMGALLIAGVIPLPGCTEIPESGLDLRYPDEAASPRSLFEARRALKRWNEYWESEMELDPTTVTPVSQTPFEFLLWCLEDYEQEGDVWKPSWLRYWLAFTQMEPESGAPLPAPPRLVTRAAELEGFASVIRDTVAGQGVSPASKATPLSPLTTKVIELIRSDGKLTVKDLVVQALALVDDPQNPGAVWVRLSTMAQSGTHPTIRYVDPLTVEIPYGVAGWKKWRRRSLTQYLRRHTVKAAADLQKPNT